MTLHGHNRLLLFMTEFGGRQAGEVGSLPRDKQSGKGHRH